jgi:type IV pilus assembly protein PilQ
VGFLFKNRETIDDKTELLVFVTPRIVAENLAVR